MRTILNTAYVAAAMLALAAVPASAATVRYSYTGASTSTFSGTQTVIGPPPNPTVTPWNPSTPVTGWIEIDTALGANLTNVDISSLVDRWAFDSGTNSGDALHIRNIDFPCPCGSFVTMFVSTNTEGAITEWNLDAYVGYSTGDQRFTSRFSGTPLGTNGESIHKSDGSSPGICCGLIWAASSASVGSWSGPAVVPIPAAVWLFVSGLGLLGLFRRRQTA